MASTSNIFDQTDLILKFSGSKYHVHKSIMTKRSEMLKAYLVFSSTDGYDDTTSRGEGSLQDINKIQEIQIVDVDVPTELTEYLLNTPAGGKPHPERQKHIFELYLLTAYGLVSPSSCQHLQEVLGVAAVADYMLSKDILAACDEVIASGIHSGLNYHNWFLIITRRCSLSRSHNIILTKLGQDIANNKTEVGDLFMLQLSDFGLVLEDKSIPFLSRFRMLIMYAAYLRDKKLSDVQVDKLIEISITCNEMVKYLCYGYDVLIPLCTETTDLKFVSAITNALAFRKDRGVEDASSKLLRSVLKRHEDILARLTECQSCHHPVSKTCGSCHLRP